MNITSTEKENAQLIELFYSGQTSALDTIFRKYKARLYAYLLTAVRDPALAKDLLQDTLVKAYNSIIRHQYRDDGRFEPWLFRIARNIVVDYYRSSKRASQLFADAELCPQRSFSSNDLGPDSLLISSQRKEQVRSLIKMLPQSQREVVILRHFMGMSFQEIADHTNVSINTALGRMRYALINMRKYAQNQESLLV